MRWPASLREEEKRGLCRRIAEEYRAEASATNLFLDGYLPIFGSPVEGRVENIMRARSSSQAQRYQELSQAWYLPLVRYQSLERRLENLQGQ